MVYICRRETFNASHKLYNPNWSKEQNEAMFGVCANENWHGHNFELVVTVKGIPDLESGMVIDYKVLSKIIRKEIIEKVHYKNLNLDVDFLQNKMPSCEILIIEFWKKLAPAIRAVSPKSELHHLKLIETKNNFVEYMGEGLEHYQDLTLKNQAINDAV
ncbi:6-carboxytetrahydropterin synthase QueD [marine bacterium AO1-C]|nr:6-carboxytetrahydropterin synthase QueD [marine bacterium AO1-C]